MSRLIETHSARNPRLFFFHGIVAAVVLILAGGLAYRQLFKTTLYSERERLQNQRRVIVPGPRGNIYDRDGKVLVGNQPRFSVVLDLAELRPEFKKEYQVVKANYAKLPADQRPNTDQLGRIARTSVAQRYLDQINFILGRSEKISTAGLKQHMDEALLLPFVLLNDLTAAEYARLIEKLPVNSPVQVHTSSVRSYPYGSAAAHTLGFIGSDNDPEAEDFPGDDLLTFKMKGSIGRTGLEKVFDAQLQGETGGAVYLVDPAGYKVDLPIEKRLPVQGKNLVTSLDIELQQAAEKAMLDAQGVGRPGAAVALDIKTGEVLVMASMPDYDPLTRVPILNPGDDIANSGVWLNRAVQGQYPPGSTFKIITSTAALRSGTIEPTTARVDCPGFLIIGNRKFPCDEVHGKDVDLLLAIRRSCNVFFYKYGMETGQELITAEARRFGFDEKTGIELPSEFPTPHVASPAWKQAAGHGAWQLGDVANMSIGQGYTLVTPLHVACMMASFARGETRTKPTLLHDPNRPPQHSEAIGLSPSDYNAILEGLRQCYRFGTARLAQVEGVDGAAKTGTAQKGKIDLAWMVAFAPINDPQIAIAVVMEGTEPDVNYHGSTYAAPIVKAILSAWKDKQDRPPVEKIDFKVGQPAKRPKGA